MFFRTQLNFYLAQSSNHFTTELPSLIRSNDIPLAYSSSIPFGLKPQTQQPLCSLYPCFQVYLTTICGGYVLCRTSLLCTIFSIILKNVFCNPFDYFVKIRNVFHISKYFYNYFLIIFFTFSTWSSINFDNL